MSTPIQRPSGFPGWPMILFNKNRILGEVEGRGFSQLMADLPYERTIIGLIALATMEGAYQITLDYVRERRAFGQASQIFRIPGLSWPRLRRRLRSVAPLLTVALKISLQGAWMIGPRFDGEATGLRDPGARFWTECLQLFGGLRLHEPISDRTDVCRCSNSGASTEEQTKS